MTAIWEHRSLGREEGHRVPPKTLEEERATGTRPTGRLHVGQMAEIRAGDQLRLPQQFPSDPYQTQATSWCDHSAISLGLSICRLCYHLSFCRLNAQKDPGRPPPLPLVLKRKSAPDGAVGLEGPIWVRGVKGQSVTCKRRTSCQGLFIKSLSNSPSCLAFSQPQPKLSLHRGQTGSQGSVLTHAPSWALTVTFRPLLWVLRWKASQRVESGVWESQSARKSLVRSQPWNHTALHT